MSPNRTGWGDFAARSAVSQLSLFASVPIPIPFSLVFEKGCPLSVVLALCLDRIRIPPLRYSAVTNEPGTSNRWLLRSQVSKSSGFLLREVRESLVSIAAQEPVSFSLSRYPTVGEAR